MSIDINCLQLIGSGDVRTIVTNVFPNPKARPNPITLQIAHVNSNDAKALGYRIDRALGRFNGHLLRGHEAHAHFSPSGIDLVPTADMAVVAAIMADSWEGVDDLSDLCFCGEIADGGFVPLPNPLQAGLIAHQHDLTLVCPHESAPLAALTGATVLGLSSVDELADLVLGHRPAPAGAPGHLDTRNGQGVDMAHVIGQAGPRRALEIAVAGGHNLLMVGPPGEGKSLLAKVIPTIAPPMTTGEMVEVTSIHLQHGMLGKGELMASRPVRAVDPAATKNSVIGGGHANPYPGEASLAHHGVMFCDEILQFKPAVLEALRGPLQDHKVVINRVNWKIEWPANFQLVAACNPCPCGYWGHPRRECTCTPGQRRRYAGKLSGPVVDRIPVRVWVHPLGEEKFNSPAGEPSHEVRNRVLEARRAQDERLGGGRTNDDIGPADQGLIKLRPEAEAHLRSLNERLVLSTRSVHNLRKVARTVADLEGSGAVEAWHLEEASKFLEVKLPTE